MDRPTVQKKLKLSVEEEIIEQRLVNLLGFKESTPCKRQMESELTSFLIKAKRRQLNMLFENIKQGQPKCTMNSATNLEN